jgi:hypothetical protein
MEHIENKLIERRTIGKRKGSNRRGQGQEKAMRGEYDQSILYPYMKMS